MKAAAGADPQEEDKAEAAEKARERGSGCGEQVHGVVCRARRNGGRPSPAGRLAEEAGGWRQHENPGEVNPLCIPKTFTYFFNFEDFMF